MHSAKSGKLCLAACSSYVNINACTAGCKCQSLEHDALRCRKMCVGKASEIMQTGALQNRARMLEARTLESLQADRLTT